MTIAVTAPVILLLIMGGLLAWQITRMADASDTVSRTNAQLAKLYELRTQIAEQESSLRAYLLSGDRSLLVPFQQAKPQESVTELRALLIDPEQIQRVTEVGTNLATWLDLANRATTQEVAVAREDSAGLQQRVRSISRARELLSQTIAKADALLMERSKDSSETNRNAKLVFVGLLGLSTLTIAFVSRKQLSTVSSAFQSVVDDERVARKSAADKEWVRRGEAQISAVIVGERTVEQVATAALTSLAEHTNATLGAVYQVQGGELQRVASRGVAADAPRSFPANAGQLGHAITERKPVRVKDADAQLSVAGGIAKRVTVEVAIGPAMIDDRAIAVIELGYASAPPAQLDELLAGVSTPIALAIRGAEQRTRLQNLLEETQRQGEELQTQQEELRVSNEELEQQSNALREANIRQQNIQHEIEAANANLEEQTATLEQQREELLGAQRRLQEHARELQQASTYKSEFLARMSHELRTPLNSSLILARLLGDNPSGNLTAEQVKFANTIYSAGNDLLVLINDILDLSKIEAGRLELRVGQVSVGRVRDTLLREFEPVAQSRGLALEVNVLPNVPAQLHTDEQRLIQVLRNLISNALKFTERGGVTMLVTATSDRIQFAVKDTGIGIPGEHAEKVFEAFHQVDGSVSRKHGGTGLGLAISRDLAALLGGDLRLLSEPGRGSTFTLDIPQIAPAQEPAPAPAISVSAPRPRPSPSPASPAHAPPPARPSGMHSIAPARTAEDDRENLDKMRRTLLIIEDDPAFRTILRDLGRELGYQVITAGHADEGVSLALRYVPDGILCDVNLPDHSGLSVLERLKRQPSIRHVPIHMISVENHAQRSLELGAVGYLLKPAGRDELVAAIKRIEDRTSQRVRRVLVVEDDPVQAEALGHLLGGTGVEIATTPSIKDSLEQLGKTTFDCVVMDLRLSDGTGFELLEKMTADERITFPPVIIYTGKALTDQEEAKLRHYSSSIIVKGARSPERLLDEVTLFLHQVEAEMPPDRQKILREVRDREAIFEGRTVLIVEDDVRNVFALSSILEPRGLKTVIARNGREALATLERTPVDLVLMDVMMPEMNGIEATQKIRQKPQWKLLPIIALTAKAMADDRQECLDAGANDYLAKPINVDMLLSLLRVWMPR